MTSSTLHLSNLSTENYDSSKPKLANFHDLFQDREFKDFVGGRLGSSIKTRGSVREKTALRLLNKEMDNLLQSSLTEVHLGYDGLQKLSQSQFKETVKKIKVTINSSNREQVVRDIQFGDYIPADALKLLSPNIFKNLKSAKVIIDKNIDNNLYIYNEGGLRLNVFFDEFLYLEGLKIVNQSQILFSIQFEGDTNNKEYNNNNYYYDNKLEISNSQSEKISLDCSYCEAHIYDINIIGIREWGLSAYLYSQSIFERISVDGARDTGVEMIDCHSTQLRNISIKNCQSDSFSIYKCQNFDIYNISISQSKIGVNFIESSNCCIQDGIVETSSHGIVLSRSQIGYRNVSISCVDGQDVFQKIGQSSWIRLE